VQVYSVQFGTAHLHARGGGGTLEPMLGLVALACVGGLLLPSLTFLVTHVRGPWRARRSRRRRLRAAANAERRAWALMSELCPHGWQAQITLFGSSEDRVAAAPHGEPARVALDWAAYEDEIGRAGVVRRVWGQSINEALDKMLADRRTDETLEQIEQGAVADGILWPDW
jgi:hypothetical protein